MLEMMIDNKNGNVWDVSEIAADITWKTSRFGKPGSLDFTLIKNALYQEQAFTYSNGDIVTFRKDGRNVFKGYIFGIGGGREEKVSVKCYDQIRYLLNKDTYVFENVKASDVLRLIAADFNLQTGYIDDTGYLIPTMSEDGQTLLDIVTKALDLTLINANRNYVLYDNFGSLEIRNIESLLLEFIIGDDSLMTDYQLDTSIDKDTYNFFKLYKDNKDTGKREVFIAKDSVNMAKWGTLQLYQSVNENMNTAQINEMLTQLSTIKNRESRTLKLNALGDINVRAGCYVPVTIEEYDIKQPFIVEDCTHRFSGSDHTMQLELKVII
nr:hypothetical protein [Paenibacillus sp. HB172176]